MLSENITLFFEEHEELKEREVVEAGIGPLYSYAKLNSKTVGIYYSFLEEYNGPPPAIAQLTDGFKIEKALHFLESDNMVERVILFASLTALGQEYNRKVKTLKNEKLLELLEPYLKNRVVAVVGYLTPIARELWRRENLEVYVFERNRTRIGDKVLSDIFEEKYLEKADIVIFTGAALVLPNIDRLLELSRNAEIRAVVGPSASLPVDILARSGFHIIGGSFIKESERVARLVMLGAGYRTLKKLGLIEEFFYVTKEVREVGG